MIKLKNSETQKIKLWQNLKTQIVIKLKNSNGDKTQKLKLWQNSKTQNVKKLNLWQKSNCDKTQIVTILKLWQNSNCDQTKIVREKSKTQMLQISIVREKNQKLKFDKTCIVTKLENSNYDN